MALPQKIKKFLDEKKAKYEILEHKTVFTAFDKAQTLKVPEKIIGKTLVMKVNGKLALVLISASQNLDLKKFKKKTKYKKVDFVSEKLIKTKLKGVKVGAIPPFGILWNLPTFVDKNLMKNPKIIVNGGDYKFSLKISPTILKKLVPDLVIGNFGKKRK